MVTPARQVRVPDRLWVPASELARANQTTVSAIIRDALSTYLREWAELDGPPHTITSAVSKSLLRPPRQHEPVEPTFPVICPHGRQVGWALRNEPTTITSTRYCAACPECPEP